MTLNLSRPILVNICVAVGTLAIITWLDNLAKRNPFLSSPRKTLYPRLTEKEIDDLPLPPAPLPGGRDVDTPYGQIRVYEWGPEAGRKVVLLHGVSTPCISLGSLATHLVKHGCRVLTFDLFGRGYSDAPLDIPHDVRLYSTQIFLALASSPISWTGPCSIDLIGYSFGGGLAASFTRYFPDLIRSVIFLAPGGVVRTSHINWRSTFLYSIGWFPEPLLEYLVRLRLKPNVKPPHKRSETSDDVTDESRPPRTGHVAEAAIEAEVQGKEQEDAGANRYLIDVDPEAVTAWQLENHAGFVPAFMSSIRHGPIHDQHSDWRILGNHLSRKRNSTTDEDDFAMKIGRPRALLALGQNDDLVLKDEVSSDIKDVLGEENVEVAIIEGGHEFPITRSKDLADAITKFWGANNYLRLS